MQNDGRIFNPVRDLTEISLNDERTLGMEFDREIQKQVKVIHDPIVAGFINDLGQSIVKEIEPQPFIYRFRVIAEPSLNAFAVPGGYIYFHSGTILAAGSVDELAGIMGHEIAHVKAHHHARGQKKQQIPSLVTAAAGIAAAVATGEPGLLLATQGVNVAMGLKFSREFETEADHLGSIWLTRAGYEPSAITRFFERLLDERGRFPDNLPPYLFSHPGVEERIASVRAQEGGLHPRSEPDPRLAESMLIAQERLAMLIEMRRTSLPIVPAEVRQAATDSDRPAGADVNVDDLLEESGRLAEAGNVDLALLKLAHAEADTTGVTDPRLPFTEGELLFDAGRYAEAAAAYRRTVLIDSTRAQVFYKLGLAHKLADDRHRAVFALEQAVLRTAPGSDLRRRVDWEIEKLTFTIVPRSGFADGSKANPNSPPPGEARESFALGSKRMMWWAQLGEVFVSYASDMTVRWRKPDGEVEQEEPPDMLRRPFISSTLEFGEEGVQPVGEWTVEIVLKDDIIDARTIRVAR